MVDELNNKKSEIKSFIDNIFIFISKVKYSGDHPVRIINATKSIIGIDPSHPPRSLLKWVENYIRVFKPSFNLLDFKDQTNVPEIITYMQFEKYILDKNEDASIKYLGYMLISSSPTSIAEYLVQIASKISIDKLLFCWSAYRAIQLLGDNKGYPFLYHCISSLISSQEHNKENKFTEYQFYCYQFQIKNHHMVRSEKIIPLVNNFLQHLNYDQFDQYIDGVPNVLKNQIKSHGIEGIHNYLLMLDSSEITEDIILKLDTLRSTILFSKYSIDEILNGKFIKSRDVNYA